ncbi:MAG TPA: hypothetical protein VKE40_08265, partial [Gemmataceae bacterium]|nr:hypothetical protein [Gemmataceae bacterium]
MRAPGNSHRPPEKFVTPPADKFVPEPPAPTAPGPVAAAITTSPIFAVGPDAGAAPQVKVYDAATRNLKFTINAYPNTFHGGVRVAVADVTGDGQADIITGTGPGGGNKVRVWNGTNGAQLPGALGNFAAFSSSQADGVFVAAGDVTG